MLTLSYKFSVDAPSAVALFRFCKSLTFRLFSLAIPPLLLQTPNPCRAFPLCIGEVTGFEDVTFVTSVLSKISKWRRTGVGELSTLYRNLSIIYFSSFILPCYIR
ncbi:hypothetical protein S245_064186 [Arachis hypogaea]